MINILITGCGMAHIALGYLSSPELVKLQAS